MVGYVESRSNQQKSFGPWLMEERIRCCPRPEWQPPRIDGPSSIAANDQDWGRKTKPSWQFRLPVRASDASRSNKSKTQNVLSVLMLLGYSHSCSPVRPNIIVVPRRYMRSQARDRSRSSFMTGSMHLRDDVSRNLTHLNQASRLTLLSTSCASLSILS